MTESNISNPNRNPNRRRTAASFSIAVFLMLVLPAIGLAAHLLGEPELVDGLGVEDVGRDVSLAIGPTGPAISYYDSTNASLKFTEWDGSTWDVQTVETGDVGQFTSLEFDSTGDPHIAYYDTGNFSLKYATRTGVSWATETVDTDVTGDVGQYTAMALDATGDPHISYYDSKDNDLKYATNNGTSWDVVVVDSGGDVGLYNDITVDASGLPHISYFDWTNSTLKHAYKTGVWNLEVADSTFGSGWDTSIAMDTSGEPHISYYNQDTFDLKHASKSGAFWSSEILDATGDVGQSTSMAFNASGDARISYLDTDNNALKMAARQGAQWILNFVEIGVSVGEATSIGIDQTGDAHIAYYDVANTALRYIHLGSLADVEAPTLSLNINSGAEFTNDPDVDLEVVCIDQATSCTDMRFSTDDITYGGWLPFAASTPWTLIEGDGVNTLYMEVRDVSLNVTGDVDTIIVDETSPDAFALDTPANNSWVTANPTLSWSASGDLTSGLAKYMLFINGSLNRDSISAGSTSATPIAPLTDGFSYTWFMRALDNATNYTDSSATWTITVDANAPTGTLVVSGDTTWTNSPNVTLDITCSDTLSGCNDMQFNNDGGGWSGFEAFATTKAWVLGAGDGDKTVNGQLRDLAGNFVAVQDDVSLDSTGPISTIVIDGGSGYTNLTSVDLNLTCADSGIGCDEMRFSNNGAAWEGFTAFATTKNSWDLTAFGGSGGEGAKTVYGEFTDLLGNVTPVSVGVTVDTTSPTGSMTIEAGAAYTGSTSLQLQLSCSDASSGCDEMSFSNNGSDWSGWEPFGMTKDTWGIAGPDGTKTVYSRFKDLAGNTSDASATDEIELDQTGPDAFNLITPSDDSYVGVRPPMTWNGTSDNAGGSGLFEYEVWLQTPAPLQIKDLLGPATTATTPDSDIAEGPHAWFVRAIDSVGNFTDSPLFEMTVDTVAPTISSFDIEGGADWANSNTVDLNTSCTDAGSGGLACENSEMAFQNDGGAWSSWEPYANLKSGWGMVVGDGNRIVHIKVRDGLLAESTAQDDIMVDTVAPAAFTLLTPVDDSWVTADDSNPPEPTFGWNPSSDAGSGLSHYELHVDAIAPSGLGTIGPMAILKGNIPPTDVTANAEYNSRIQLSENNNTWYMRAYDVAGNFTDSATWQVGYDITDPAVNASSIVVDGLDVIIDVECTDAASGCSQLAFSPDGVNYGAPVPVIGGSTTYGLTFPDIGDGLQPLYVRAWDNAGNLLDFATDPSCDCTVWVELDTTDPTLSPVSAPVLSSDVASWKTFIISGWKTGASDGTGSGIKNYDLQWRYKDSGSWKSWQNGITGNSQSFWASDLGREYCFRARATDNAGNVSDWTVDKCTVVPFDNSYNKIWYSSGWNSHNDGGSYQGAVKYATTNGPIATVWFYGNAISWIGTMGPIMGKGRVYLDGVWYKTVDLYSSSYQKRKEVFKYKWSQPGWHYIKILSLGQKNPSSKWTRIDIDGFAVHTPDNDKPKASPVKLPNMLTDVAKWSTFTVSGWASGAKTSVYGNPITGYDVQWRFKSSGSWKSWQNGITGNSQSFWASTLGKNYCFRARAIDSAGRIGDWSAQRCTVVPYDNSYKYIWYGSGWKDHSDGNAFRGGEKYATQAGSTMTFRFTGSQVTWLASKGPIHGKARVYIDGTMVKTVDLYSSTYRYRQWAYTYSFPSRGSHTIKVVALGTKNASSAWYKVPVDGFGVVE